MRPVSRNLIPRKTSASAIMLSSCAFFRSVLPRRFRCCLLCFFCNMIVELIRVFLLVIFLVLINRPGRNLKPPAYAPRSRCSKYASAYSLFLFKLLLTTSLSLIMQIITHRLECSRRAMWTFWLDYGTPGLSILWASAVMFTFCKLLSAAPSEAFKFCPEAACVLKQLVLWG